MTPDTPHKITERQPKIRFASRCGKCMKLYNEKY